MERFPSFYVSIEILEKMLEEYYYYAKPMPEEDFYRLLLENRSAVSA